MTARPCIAHVLYRFDVGGMERFILSLINRTGDRYRHALICLDNFGALRSEIVDPAVPCVALHKQPGKDPAYYFRLWKALRTIKPDLVQTYNFGALDIAPIARLAGARGVLHSERGRDASDPNGDSDRYRRLHRWMNPFITRFLAVSRDLQEWLVREVGIDRAKTQCIPNGVDVSSYVVPQRPGQARPLLGDFAPAGSTLIVNVGRLDLVKDQASLIDAFARLPNVRPGTEAGVRLAIVGEGAQRAALAGQIRRLGLGDRVRLLGLRRDIPALLAEADVFVLSSIAEGMPGVVLEAMAAGLPVVATRVGGTPEIVVGGETGTLVMPGDPGAMAAALGGYLKDTSIRIAHGHAGRRCVEARFDLGAVVATYRSLYDDLLDHGSRAHGAGARLARPEGR